MPQVVYELIVDDKGTPILRQFAGELQRTGQQVGGTSSSLQQATQASERMASSVTNLTRQVALAGAAFLGFQGITGTLNAVTSSIVSFDRELANVNTVLGGSDTSIRALEQQILRLPPSLGSATELTKGLYQALSAGVPAGQAVGFIAEQARLSSAGLTDLSTTVKVSTAAIDAFGLSANDASHVSDVLFTIVARGKTEFAPLAASIANVFPLAKNLGLSFEDVAATMTTLTKVFPTVSEATTGFRSLLSGVISNLDNLALQNCSCDRTSFGGGSSTSCFPFFLWHWQFGNKMAPQISERAPMNRK